MQTLMVRELKGHYPAGTYVATFSGVAGVRMDQYDVKRVKTGRHIIEAEVVPGDGGLLFTARGSTVNNVHVWMPGFVQSAPRSIPFFWTASSRST